MVDRRKDVPYLTPIPYTKRKIGNCVKKMLCDVIEVHAVLHSRVFDCSDTELKWTEVILKMSFRHFECAENSK